VGLAALARRSNVQRFIFLPSLSSFLQKFGNRFVNALVSINSVMAEFSEEFIGDLHHGERIGNH
jgi:hypothetical protein